MRSGEFLLRASRRGTALVTASPILGTSAVKAAAYSRAKIVR